MIAIADLRPGNYVKVFNNGRKKLLKISLDDLFPIKDEALNVFPVDIAGEWLTKFGFAHNNSFVHFHLAPIYVLQENKDWFFMRGEIRINKHPLRYIHQLQNLFYFLSGEELIIKNNL